jgi:hypothetical protein
MPGLQRLRGTNEGPEICRPRFDQSTSRINIHSVAVHQQSAGLTG